jgi:hypothetical protein
MNANNLFSLGIGRAFGLTICTFALTACGGLTAQTHDGAGAPRKPPTEALNACKALSSGQGCSFSSPHGTVAGTCWAPAGKPLACKPTDAPGSPANAPKQ